MPRVKSRFKLPPGFQFRSIDEQVERLMAAFGPELCLIRPSGEMFGRRHYAHSLNELSGIDGLLAVLNFSSIFSRMDVVECDGWPQFNWGLKRFLELATERSPLFADSPAVNLKGLGPEYLQNTARTRRAWECLVPREPGQADFVVFPVQMGGLHAGMSAAELESCGYVQTEFGLDLLSALTFVFTHGDLFPPEMPCIIETPGTEYAFKGDGVFGDTVRIVVYDGIVEIDWNFVERRRRFHGSASGIHPIG